MSPTAHGWADDCPAGLPVPGLDRCTAVDCESVRLTALAEGERGCVTCLEAPGGPAAAKLAALGVLPGVDLELVQCYPAYVFRMGHAEVAVDVDLAEHVRVRRLGRRLGASVMFPSATLHERLADTGVAL